MISTGGTAAWVRRDGYEWRRAGDLLRCGGGHERRRKLGEIRTGESYSSDQFSQVTLTSAQLTGTEWMAVRAQDGGMTAYVGFYFWNSGSPELMLFERNQGNWNQLGSTVSTAPFRVARSSG